MMPHFHKKLGSPHLFALSALAHGLMLLVLVGSQRNSKTLVLVRLAATQVERVTRGEAHRSTPSPSRQQKSRNSTPRGKSFPPAYLPEWAGQLPLSGGKSVTESQAAATPDTGGADREDLLFAESKALNAFDVLAARMNQSMEYPQLLSENGLDGNSSLDLYFDEQGEVDETRSKTFGSNRWVRGMLVRAARQSLIAWFAGEGARLRKDQFRNQHFRAEFVLGFAPNPLPELTKVGSNSYNFLRQRPSRVPCMGQLLNVACYALEAAGAIQRATSQKYANQVSALKDRLEQYDDAGLSGVNAAIKSSGA